MVLNKEPNRLKHSGIVSVVAGPDMRLSDPHMAKRYYTPLYEFLNGKPDGTAPPIEGSYPHAVVKGLFTKDGVVDTAQDGDLTLTP